MELSTNSDQYINFSAFDVPEVANKAEQKRLAKVRRAAIKMAIKADSTHQPSDEQKK